MSIVEKIRSDLLNSRKQKSSMVAFLSFVLSEIEKIGKNSGNRETSDIEAISAIKKMISNLNGNLAYSQDDFVLSKIRNEMYYLEDFLPRLISEEEVKAFLVQSFKMGSRTKGLLMRDLKERYGVTVDMKVAGNIVTELLEKNNGS